MMTTATEQSQARTWVQENLPEIGLGGVAIGNEFEYVSDEEAYSTLQAAWQAGVRYFDVSPWYGLGLAERRYGHFLHNQNREDYFISSKVGKLLKASKNNKGAEYFPEAHSPNNVVFDYSAEGVRRSVEDSLQRLGIDSLDIVFVHDLSPDNKLLEGKWLEHFAIAEKGAFPELTRMREEGLIKGWGLGVNSPEPILKTIQVAQPDVFLLASQYSLIDHKNALNQVFPEIKKNNMALVMGSNLNAGFLSGSERYNYDPSKPIPTEYIAKRDKLREISQKHNVDLRTASLQFALYPDVAISVIPGAHTAAQVMANVQSLKVEIPEDFWQELKQQRLIEENAPVSFS
ncbi:aldo/keto reductase [Mucilaginibacter robiniae]|uniref:Aldo/keto reductase n=1 Tax=Mucilaginibacter robiniae TaxID=2728022 RepID=A0A7L5E253_9SPHI|nr:aldo/keto reductase [Mucilaginibacter robiniae]QJD94426.1 aldo/keto reductase [Mucilaginibacter robiniae]